MRKEGKRWEGRIFQKEDFFFSLSVSSSVSPSVQQKCFCVPFPPSLLPLSFFPSPKDEQNWRLNGCHIGVPFSKHKIPNRHSSIHFVTPTPPQRQNPYFLSHVPSRYGYVKSVPTDTHSLSSHCMHAVFSFLLPQRTLYVLPTDTPIHPHLH